MSPKVEQLGDATAPAALEPVVTAIADALVPVLAPRVAEIVAYQPEPWIGVKEAADYMGCSPNRIHKLTMRGELPHGKDGTKTLLRYSDIDAYLAGGPR